ncbi:MAG: nucleotidyl transferase AbiEii/AbiGii toxin family protein [Pelolinea sp.]|nr:nucleotidyl transferase AbiEii/AbiGii toxin family protein [Pelolinea sp.]
MKYNSGSSFRQALEKHILDHHHQTSIPIQRTRKLIVFERLIARLVQTDPQDWVLKGGFMMDLYFNEKSRTTKDLDLLYQNKKKDLQKQLINAGEMDLGDWFTFKISQPIFADKEIPGTSRFNIGAMLDSRPFETFHIDVNTKDILFEEPQPLLVSRFLSFAGVKPIKVLCYSLTQQISEKFHALTRNYQSGEVSRVKDLIDVLLIASQRSFASSALRESIKLTFEHRAAHPIPLSTPKIANIYSKDYSRLSAQIGLLQKSLNEGNLALEHFLLPVINSTSNQRWNPDTWKWE